MLRYFDTGFSHYEILLPVLYDGLALCLSVHCNLRYWREVRRMGYSKFGFLGGDYASLFLFIMWAARAA